MTEIDVYRPTTDVYRPTTEVYRPITGFNDNFAVINGRVYMIDEGSSYKSKLRNMIDFDVMLEQEFDLEAQQPIQTQQQQQIQHLEPTEEELEEDDFDLELGLDFKNETMKQMNKKTKTISNSNKPQPQRPEKRQRQHKPNIKKIGNTDKTKMIDSWQPDSTSEELGDPKLYIYDYSDRNWKWIFNYDARHTCRSDDDFTLDSDDRWSDNWSL